MLASFRNAAKSKFGLAMVMAFIVLMMLAFTSGDISNYFSGFNTSGSTEAVASVDGDEIRSDELRKSASNALDRARQENPTVSMATLVKSGALDELLTLLIDRKAIIAFGKEYGIVASERLVGSEINKGQAIKGADGQVGHHFFPRPANAPLLDGREASLQKPTHLLGGENFDFPGVVLGPFHHSHLVPVLGQVSPTFGETTECADDAAEVRPRRVQIGFRRQQLRLAGGELRLRLRDVGARYFADIEAVARLFQRLLEHANIALLHFDDRGVA